MLDIEKYQISFVERLSDQLKGFFSKRIPLTEYYINKLEDLLRGVIDCYEGKELPVTFLVEKWYDPCENRDKFHFKVVDLRTQDYAISLPLFYDPMISLMVERVQKYLHDHCLAKVMIEHHDL